MRAEEVSAATSTLFCSGSGGGVVVLDDSGGLAKQSGRNRVSIEQLARSFAHSAAAAAVWRFSAETEQQRR